MFKRNVALQDVSGIGVTLSIDKKSQRVKIVDTVDGSPASGVYTMCVCVRARTGVCSR